MKSRKVFLLFVGVMVGGCWAEGAPAEDICQKIDLAKTCWMCQERLDKVNQLLTLAEGDEKAELMREKDNLEATIYLLKEAAKAKGLKEYWEKIGNKIRTETETCQEKLDQVKRWTYISAAIGGVIFIACLAVGGIIIGVLLNAKNIALKEKDAAIEGLIDISRQLNEAKKLRQEFEEKNKLLRGALFKKDVTIDALQRDFDTLTKPVPLGHSSTVIPEFGEQ